MKSFVMTVEQAQRLAEGIASLPIPYTASRPLMAILEQARVVDVDEKKPDEAKE